MCVKGDSVAHLKLIYLLHFKLFRYFKIILFLALFVVVFLFSFFFFGNHIRVFLKFVLYMSVIYI